MCDPNIGCQLRTNYFGFRLGGTGSAVGGLGAYDGATIYRDFGLDGAVSGGFDFALTLRRARSDSPTDGSFEGIGGNLGYMGEWTTRGSFLHVPYFTLELWTHDARLTPFVGLAYTNEQFDNGEVRHGGRILLGTLWRPFTSPMQGDRVNPYLGGNIFIGGDGGGGRGGFVIGLNLTVGLDFFPLF